MNKSGKIRVGTSAFTAAGWPGTFYPEGMKPADYLSFYATKFDTVEVDSTFYRTPGAGMVNGWYQKTPNNFVFSLKVPQVITHERLLAACEVETDTFLENVSLLREKLGVLLLQFGYFNKEIFKTPAVFMQRLHYFLGNYAKDFKFAVEIRNKNWLNKEFADMLREHNTALVLQDQLWMPLPAQMEFDYLTAPFTYVRLLGDRKGIEKQTKVWDKQIVKRSKELKSWVDVCRQAVRRGTATYLYINNHYSGFAPGCCVDFMKLWNKS